MIDLVVFYLFQKNVIGGSDRIIFRKLIMSDNVIAEVSQHSRESGRVPVHVLVDRLYDERKKLIIEKQKIEAALSDVESIKRDSLTKLYRRGIHKTDACAQTNEIEVKYRKDRAQLIRDKSAIEERLNDIKNRLTVTKLNEPREDIAVLKRIEILLVEIRDRLPS